MTCIKKVKGTYREWAAAGKPRTGHLFVENKMAKKNLRAHQRREEQIRKKSLYDALMEKPSSEMFYKLISRSKSLKQSDTTCIQVNGQKHFDPEQQRVCFANYFEDLAMPKDKNYDSVFLELCNVRCRETENDFSEQTEDSLTFSNKNVEEAIDKLNSGKSPDEYGLTAEHLKAAKHLITPVITETFNQIIKEKTVPSSFKTGIITPVLKKGKDAKAMENYRGITVSGALGKLFEYSVLSKLNFTQSSQQFGFTTGLSPIMAGLLVSEAKAEVQLSGSEGLFLATLDSQKAFDVVHHTILLEKLAQKGVHKDIWLIVKNLYEGLTSKVKWIGQCSESFPVKQGVRQGGILSTHLYKVFIDDFLETLQNKRLGLRIGTVYTGSPACCDDVAFLTKFKEELQIMFNEAKGYSGKHRYEIHPTKTNVVVAENEHKVKDNPSWTLGENLIQTTDSAVHLGISRSGKKESNINTTERISVARRTSYSLMNTGLHGSNGLSPEVSYQIYKTYVVPRLLYGLEIIPLTKTQLEQFSRYHLRTLRHLQSLLGLGTAYRNRTAVYRGTLLHTAVRTTVYRNSIKLTVFVNCQQQWSYI